jgi:peptidoglycan hydrolase-like protein with peptidoglycan-binding domain
MDRGNTCRRFAAAAATLLLGISMCFFGISAHADTSSPQKPRHAVHHKSKRKTARHARVRGQKAIDGDRAREIQEALIREHYLKGQPTGQWDAATQTAMRKYQADQGWQNKTVPDSRALIRLGLGPDNGRLLNPESAMTTAPVLPHASMSGASKSSPAATSDSIPAATSLPASSTPVSTGAPAITGDPVR